MVSKIGMPNLGHTMEQGTVVEWMKGEGSSIGKGEVILTVEGDKSTFDVESPVAGVLLRILVPAGQVVPVGTTLGLVGDPSELNDKSPNQERIEATRPHVGDSEKSSTDSGSVNASRMDRIRATPVARRLATEKKLELSQIVGSGVDGLIEKEDVLRAEAAIGSRDAARMRQAIGRRMEHTWRNTPMVTLHRDADVTDLVAFRRDAVDAEVTINDLLLRATAAALNRHPELNAWYENGEVVPASSVELGFVVSVSGGLVVPVIHDAGRKSVHSIAKITRALSTKAKHGSLSPLDLKGASFTVSNLGAWAIDGFSPIINSPQVAILGVGRVRRVAEEESGAVAFRSKIGLSLVFDHRAIDGIAGAEMLESVSAELQQPSSLFAKDAGTIQ